MTHHAACVSAHVDARSRLKQRPQLGAVGLNQVLDIHLLEEVRGGGRNSMSEHKPGSQLVADDSHVSTRKMFANRVCRPA